MRCPDCNKFVSFDSEQYPEVDVEIDEEGHVSGSVRIVNCCAECGTEMKEYNFEIDEDYSDELNGEHIPEDEEDDRHELEVETVSENRIEYSGYYDRKTGKFVEAAGRYAKHFYGYEIEIQIKCKCGFTLNKTIKDSVSASEMEEIC